MVFVNANRDTINIMENVLNQQLMEQINQDLVELQAISNRLSINAYHALLDVSAVLAIIIAINVIAISDMML